MTKNDLAAELGRSLFGVVKHAKRSMRADLEELGVTMPQAMMVQHLASAGGRMTIRQVGQECDMLASTATGVIDRLEQAGHVRRVRDLDDRRVVWVELTDTGQELNERLPVFSARVAGLFKVLSVAELEQMLDAVRRVNAAAQEGDD
jgi:DNA-binding MarR family transcriptional regulator